MTSRLILGDCLDIMKKIPDNSFDRIRNLPSEEIQALWTRALNKGDVFFIRKMEYKVIVYSEKTFRIKNTESVNYTFKIYNKNCFMATGKEGNLLRDVEGIIRCDLLNEYNNFHVLSDVFKLTVKAIIR